jgi:2'-5' RNA ligase
MMKRAIHIFPSFQSVDKIQEIRNRYDPLSDKIPPHITLVFPFESSIPSVDILVHIKSVAEHMSPFHMTLKDVTGSGGEFLFWNVKKGNDFLIQLHDELYEGILAPYRNPRYTYSPHITLGRPGNSEEYINALEEYQDWRDTFHTVVKEITLEEIGEDDVSNVIGRVPLEGDRF